jgi:hypothetical protein
MRLLLVVSLAAAACNNASTGKARDLGLAHLICPDNPGNCQGKCCGSACVDIAIDSHNCGDCNHQCPADQLCLGGRCGGCQSGASCAGGQVCCSAAGCRSLSNDVENCGQCGNACDLTAACIGGKCLCGNVECSAGQHCCKGVCGSCSFPGPMDMSMPNDLGSTPPPSPSPSPTPSPPPPPPTLPPCDCSDFPLGCVGSCVGHDCCSIDAFFGRCKAQPNRCQPS